MDKWIDAEVKAEGKYRFMTIQIGSERITLSRTDALLLIDKMCGCIGQMALPGTMTCDEIKAGHAADCEVAGDCNYCGGPVYHRPGKPGEYDHECNPPAKTDMEIIAEQCAAIEARRGY